jgi:hypothetical protein
MAGTEKRDIFKLLKEIEADLTEVSADLRDVRRTTAKITADLAAHMAKIKRQIRLTRWR